MEVSLYPKTTDIYSKVKIRSAIGSDVINVSVLKQQVWISTYAEDGIRDDFSKYVLDEYSPTKILKVIQDTSKMTLLAEINNILVGCVEINLVAEKVNETSRSGLEINNLYILERFQNQGIGKVLLDKSVEITRYLDYSVSWLTVYFKNEKAIRFYERNSFKSVGQKDFILDGKNYTNLVMVRDF